MYRLSSPHEPDEIGPCETTKSMLAETAARRCCAGGPGLSLHKKRKVVRMYDAGRRQSAIARHFRVPPETVARVVRNRHKYGGAACDHRRRRYRRREDEDEDALVRLEAMLAGWYALVRHWGVRVARADLVAKALLFNAALDGPADFGAGRAWRARFAKRHALPALPDRRHPSSREQAVKLQVCHCVEQVLLRAPHERHTVFGIKALRAFGCKWIKDFVEVQEKIMAEAPPGDEEDEAYTAKVKATWHRKLQLMAVDLQFLLLRF